MEISSLVRSTSTSAVSWEGGNELDLSGGQPPKSRRSSRAVGMRIVGLILIISGISGAPQEFRVNFVPV